MWGQLAATHLRVCKAGQDTEQMQCPLSVELIHGKKNLYIGFPKHDNSHKMYMVLLLMNSEAAAESVIKENSEW